MAAIRGHSARSAPANTACHWLWLHIRVALTSERSHLRARYCLSALNDKARSKVETEEFSPLDEGPVSMRFFALEPKTPRDLSVCVAYVEGVLSTTRHGTQFHIYLPPRRSGLSFMPHGVRYLFTIPFRAWPPIRFPPLRYYHHVLLPA